LYADQARCPEKFLLWFHRAAWDQSMRSKRILWDELCFAYQEGVDSVAWLQKQWKSLEGKIDPSVFRHVESLLEIQYREATWWRDACLLYFQQFSKRDLPSGVGKPEKSLAYYQSLEFPFAPGIRPKW
jgi:alpha-glucuronidase